MSEAHPVPFHMRPVGVKQEQDSCMPKQSRS